ncbi:MAG: bifunctional proline dehydrogenase/L-glutamate gamma-semialdehyde dehydrogenase PutA, partial [Pseudomonadota bacterium]
QELYEAVLDDAAFNGHCRVYAPVGRHEDLLPYLVRRLLENGANTSFVNRIVDEKLPVEAVVSDPIAQVEAFEHFAHPHIRLPRHLYAEARLNSCGVNLAAEHEQTTLIEAMSPFAEHQWFAPAAAVTADGMVIQSPADRTDVVGRAERCEPEAADAAVRRARRAWPDWDRTPVDQRAACLDAMADALEQHQPELMVLCVREAGKSLVDAVAEVRESIDFCRYYAAQARAEFGRPVDLAGPTGEQNQLSLHGRGVFVCISPWNFPLAIFVGQVAAALVAGNSVIAKPAEQTPLIAARAVELLHQSGVPNDVLQLLPGDGRLGAALTQHEQVAGVAFTGSTATARLINRSLAARNGPIGVLIAETGGQNAMLVDSSALAEQVVKDVIQSAFLSAGQRCSALRVLYLQRDIADHVMTMLAGAMQELTIGRPGQWSTDIGPVIDADQLAMLNAHVEKLQSMGRVIARVPMPDALPEGHWFAPAAFEIDSIDQLDGEVFGPVLHVVRYSSRDINQVIEQINATGYGLTLGVHSRIDRSQDYIADRVRVGNAYINRNMTGAVVGVQPFGGEGLSGTGPKAGGPHYLHRFAVERTRTVNTAAVGGNASLMVLSD